MSVGAPADFGVEYLLYLFGIVAFGAIVPVVPTGAAVSVAAVLADRDHVLLTVLVVLVGAAGAYVGDIVTYGVLKLAGKGLAERIGWLQQGTADRTLRRLRAQIEAHQLRSLLLSRLIPGGRVPVLLAAALGGYSWRRFAVADVAAAGLWSLFYALLGVAGRAVFPKPWQAALAVVVLVVVLSVAGSAWSRRRRERTVPSTPSGGAVTPGNS